MQIKWLKDKLFYKKQDFETFDSNGNIYTLFFEIANKVLKANGIGIFITMNAWLISNYGEKTRNYFYYKTNPKNIINLGANVFESATVDTCITLWKKEKYNGSTYLSNISANEISNHRLSDSDKKSLLPNSLWKAMDDGNESELLKTKVEKIQTNLIDIGLQLDYGILTGANPVFILDEARAKKLISLDKKNAELIKPILRGKDIERYQAKFQGYYLLCTHNGIKSKDIKPIDLMDYPSLISYFESFGENFKKRGEQGDNYWNLRNCAYIDKFETPKIVYADIVKESGKFYYDADNYYTNDTAFIMTGKNLKYALAILNSKLFNYLYKTFYCGGSLGNKGLRFKKDFLLRVPIPTATAAQQEPIIALVDKILAAKKQDPKAVTLALEAQIDALVYKLYGLTEEEIAVVEGK